MTQPAKPADHPALEDAPKVDTNVDDAPNGIPLGAGQADATANPTSDRQETETAALPDKT